MRIALRVLALLIVTCFRIVSGRPGKSYGNWQHKLTGCNARNQAINSWQQWEGGGVVKLILGLRRTEALG